MAKTCARAECGKTVYPIEELKCLDKVWHKQCFKCTVCGMTLNMKNYKGYDKMPYCEPHYPKTVASVVVDTPEMRRLAENTRLQSQIKYHEEFEKSKGQRIQLADDPEVARHLRNTKVQSQAAYHGELEKKKHQDEIRPSAEQKPVVANAQTSRMNNKIESASIYSPGKSQFASDQTGINFPNTTMIYSSERGGRVPIEDRQVGSIADYDPLNGNWGSIASSRNAQKIGQLGGLQKATTQSTSTPTTVPSTGAPLGAIKKTSGGGYTVKAMYDYSAADKDEVSFVEGDLILNCQPVDEGWMTGTVQRTKQWGMLPANYVEKVKQPIGSTGLHYLS